MNEKAIKETWSENVILADADYIDRVAFDLIVNFERMLGRPIPKADLARWIDCVALDAGMRPLESLPQSGEIGGDSTQVILLHAKERKQLDNFTPGNYAEELDGKAFRDQLGEFCISCIPVERMTTMEDLFTESLQHICQQKEVKRLMVVGDDQYYDRIKAALGGGQRTNHKSQISNLKSQIKKNLTPITTTVFTMQPMPGGRFRQEILGYSLMAALGIKSAEIGDG